MFKRLVRNLAGTRHAPASEPAGLVERAAAAHRSGERGQARELYLEALALDARNADALHLLGVLEYQERHYDQAVELIEDAISLQPEAADFQMNCANAYLARGQVATAIDRLKTALCLRPDYPKAQANLLFAMNYDEGTIPDEVFAAHRAWGNAARARIGARHPERDRDPARRLRIGYLSPDFRTHAVAPFIEVALAHHDPQEAEVFCYDNSPAADAVTVRMQAYPLSWRRIRELDDESAADLIEDDRIDILVDLAGHNVGGRLELLARRPAPMQAALLGYLNTTGLDSIDYRITDAWADPPGDADRCHSEELWRLPGSFWCFRPPDSAPDVTPPPALDNGFVTFGSFNNFPKLNQLVAATWTELLRRCPGSRLLVVGAPEGSARMTWAARFGEAGIDPTRIELAGRVSLDDYRQLHGRVDLALDSFPYTGGATTCEALWMGVPVVGLRGGFGFAGSAASILNAAGLAGLLADSAAHYVDIAAALARDVPRLAALRAGLREQVRQSPLTDGAGLARRLQAAYRAMWVRRCAAADKSR